MSEFLVENEIVMKAVADIIPYEKNPRKNDKTVELLCQIIPKVGFNVPLVIDADNVIVKGHARFEAAKRLGLEKLPCIITHADKDAIRADRIADNKISEFSEWINEELMHEVDMLDLEYDFTDMGLPRMTFDDIPNFFSEPDVAEEDDVGQTYTEEERRQIYEAFLEQQTKKNAQATQMTSQAALDAAVWKQQNIVTPRRDYAKCVCPKCGNVMYVNRNVLYDRNGTIRRV